MTSNNSILLYVADAEASARYFTRLLGLEPVEASPTFAMFRLPSGLGLGLWGRNGVKPAPIAAGGGCEIAFRVADAAAVDTHYRDWSGKGADILMPPTDLEFGRSFVATDHDGHRLRVYAVADGG